MMENFVLLGDLCATITKGTTPNAGDGGFAQSGINYIKSESLSYDGMIDASKFAFITPETNARLRRSIIRADDILYSIAGANLGKCGKAREEHLPANTNQAVAIIRVDPSLACPSFVSLFLRNPTFVQSVIGGVAQSAQPNVNLGEIGRFKIPNFSLAKQHAIAAVLSALDDKIELNRRMNETLEAMARAIFKDWFVDFGPTRAKMEGRAPYLAPDIWSLFPDRLDDEGKPEGWESVPLSKCCSAIFSGGTPSTSVAEFWGGDIPWLSSGETRNLVVTETERSITQAGVDNSSTRLATKGSTVIASAGQGNTRGQTALLARDMYINQSVIALKADYLVTTDILLFLDVSRRYDQLRQISDSNSSRGSLTTKMIASLTTFVAPLELMRQADLCVSPFLNRIVANDHESGTLAATRDLLLPKLMSGEIRVKDAEKIVGKVV